jgi:hypothetical protein
MDARPYVGVTGPVTKEEVMEICREFHEAGFGETSSHVPMIGFLVSQKTLNGGYMNRRYPAFSSLPDILRVVDKPVFATIHYTTKELTTLADQVAAVFGDGIYDKGLCRGVQLNVVWPDIMQVGMIKARFPEIKVIFQANEHVLDGSPAYDIAKRLVAYEGVIDYVLIDPSGGKGRVSDLDYPLDVYWTLGENLHDVKLGIAGGFNGDNVTSRMWEIQDAVRELFCIDAEGGLRDKITDRFGDDTLNIDKVRAYLQAASRALK